MIKNEIKKNNCIVIAFNNTEEAIKCENAAKKAGKNKIVGKIIPLPKQIDAGCGLAFSINIDENKKIDEEYINKFLDENKLKYKTIKTICF